MNKDATWKAGAQLRCSRERGKQVDWFQASINPAQRCMTIDNALLGLIFLNISVVYLDEEAKRKYVNYFDFSTSRLFSSSNIFFFEDFDQSLTLRTA